MGILQPHLWGSLATPDQKCHEADCETGPRLQELSFLVSPHDLQLDGANILIQVNGMVYTVSSLERKGLHWLAKTDARVNDCPAGHLTCEGCGQCHTEKCWYFVKHCKLWR